MKRQRVRYLDALKMFEKRVAKFKSKTEQAIIFDEDFAGGNQAYINETLVKDFLKKLTR